MNKLALFDLDNTLISGDSDYEWGAYLCEIQAVDENFYRAKNEHFYQQYCDEKLDIDEYLNFSLRPLADNAFATILAWRNDFINKKIVPLIKPKALRLLHQHRNDTKVIITSTNRFITAPIANLLGVDALIATELEWRNGCYTGMPEPPPCFRENKIKCLENWLAQCRANYEEIWCYSDSINDLPLLQFSDQAIVVDGDEKLLSYAHKNNWRSINL